MQATADTCSIADIWRQACICQVPPFESRGISERQKVQPMAGPSRLLLYCNGCVKCWLELEPQLACDLDDAGVIGGADLTELAAALKQIWIFELRDVESIEEIAAQFEEHAVVTTKQLGYFGD